MYGTGPRKGPHMVRRVARRAAVMRSVVLVLRATRLRVKACRTSRARRRSVARVMPKDSD